MNEVKRQIRHQLSFPISQYVFYFRKHLEPGLEEVLNERLLRPILDKVADDSVDHGLLHLPLEPSEYNQVFQELHAHWLELAMSLPKTYGAAGASWKFFMIVVSTEVVRQMLSKNPTEIETSDIALTSLEKNFQILRS